MGYKYAVIGSGRQGTAAAADLARHGDAEDVLLIDSVETRAREAAEHVSRLARGVSVRPGWVSADDPDELGQALEGRDAALSALPYRLNAAAARVALSVGCSFNDLGGNTDIVQEELALHDDAAAAGVSIVPDCGLAPGMANVLAAEIVSRFDEPEEVQIWCGGLPRDRTLPLGYRLTFNVGGLTNEYTGDAVILRGGKITRRPALSDDEIVEFPSPVGRCEAFLTSGGTSTGPWTWEGKLSTFEYRTVRYPGHLAGMRALATLGYFDEEPIRLGIRRIVPRDVTHALLGARLDFPDEPDLVVLRVRGTGRRARRKIGLVFEILEHSDPATGFTAMERCTGFPAAVVTAMQARGDIPSGARPQEVAVPATRFLEEIRRRGLQVTERTETAVR